MKVTSKAFGIFICFLVFTLIGCDAFVRKFTRKPNKENIPEEEMVLVPEEYKGPNLSKPDLYRKYLMYWKSWHDELMESLLQNLSHKKKVDCAQQAIKNLLSLNALLKPEKQKQLDVYIRRLTELKDSIDSDIYGINNNNNRSEARHIKLDILRDFSYPEVRNDLI